MQLDHNHSHSYKPLKRNQNNKVGLNRKNLNINEYYQTYQQTDVLELVQSFNGGTEFLFKP